MTPTAHAAPDFKRLNLEIFARPEGAPVLFQPRIEFWITENRDKGTLPEGYAGLDNFQIFDTLGCSPRAYDVFNACLGVQFPSCQVEAKTLEDGLVYYTRWVTPVGELTQELVSKPMWRYRQWAVKSPEDLRVLEYILRDRVYTWDHELYAREEARLGRRAAPQIFIPRVNVMQMMLEWMDIEPTMFALMCEPEKMERILGVIDQAEEQMLGVIAAAGVPIINYGDNIDGRLVSPDYMERFILPAYERRSAALHAAGKFVFAHFDGALASLLPYIARLPLDGIEALTPLPQGDVTIEQMREAVPQNMVLLDGIPMLDFLPETPLEDLEARTRQLLDLFDGKLILGVSDEISPVCDIERVALVSRMVEDWNRRR